MLRIILVLSFILTALVASGSSASAATVSVCGTLQALTHPNPPQQEGPGSVTIDGKTYVLSSALPTNATNIIGSGVVIGKRVCLLGEVEGSEGSTSALATLNNYVLAACDQPGAPAGCATAASSTLPSTTTADGRAARPSKDTASDASVLIALSLAALAAAIAAAAMLHRARRA